MNTKIYTNVKIGKNAEIGDFVVIGKPDKDKKDGEVKTVIGDNAVIRSHTVIYAGNKIGDNFQTGHHTNIRADNEIENNVSIGTMSVVEHNTKIKEGVRIHSQAFIPEFSVLEKNVWIGPNVVLTNAQYPASKKAKKKLMCVLIKENAKVGANVTILPGVIIGKNALIGAGSVVTKNVPADAVVVGNPAKIIKKVFDLFYKDSKEKAY